MCEGEKTEPNYFRAFPVPADVAVEVVGEGANTVSLVKKALARAKAAAKAGAAYDEVWVVYDQDSFGPKAFNTADATIAKHNQAGPEAWGAAWSNQAFEVWYLLHFQYFDTRLDRVVVTEKLNACLGGYAKNDPNLYAKLKPHQATAIQRAHTLALAKGVAPHGRTLPADAWSCTQVHRLVEALNAEVR